MSVFSSLLAIGLGGGLLCNAEPTVLVVGLDGGDWDVIEPLVEAGRLPVMAELLRTGTRGDFDCTPAWPEFSCFCPPVWVSIATGQPAVRHGIRSFQPSTARQAKAVWQVLAETGGSSVLSSWRNTDPPDPGPDFVFTEAGNAGVGARLFRAWTTPVPEDDEIVSQPPGLYGLLGMLPEEAPTVQAHDIFAQDRAAMQSFHRLSALLAFAAPFIETPRLSMITLHSPDKAEHVAWGAIQPDPAQPVSTQEVLRAADAWTGPITGGPPFAFGTPVSQYLEIDQWLAQLLSLIHYEYVVFVSDHGMTRNRAAGLSGVHNYAHPEAHNGIFAVAGPGIRRGALVHDVDVLDVAPLVAYLLGLPVADDLPGRVPVEIFVPGWLARYPIERIASWDAEPVPSQHAKPRLYRSAPRSTPEWHFAHPHRACVPAAQRPSRLP